LATKAESTGVAVAAMAAEARAAKRTLVATKGMSFTFLVSSPAKKRDWGADVPSKVAKPPP
jgi:hypothetical protein